MALVESSAGVALIVGGADGSLAVIDWDGAARTRWDVPDAHSAAISMLAVAATADGGLLISAADDCTVSTWDFMLESADKYGHAI
mmetsp:Transcript_10208/g.30733  ORF Transcript_10208/g.30733 Transcript_10208/m.30733 type:complete len:85 (-) Transcript_10208:25-279(-)